MLRLPNRLLVAILVVWFVGCAGGGSGCSGCSCGGITPLPEGFNTEKRIENAASVRITDSGITFLEDNIGALAAQFLGANGSGASGVITFPIPESTSDIKDPIFGAKIGEFTVCPGGADEQNNKCIFEVDIANADLDITPQAGHHIRVTGPLPVRLQNLPIDYELLISGNVAVAVNGNGQCGEGQTFGNVDIDVLVSIEIDEDTMHARYGYSHIRIPTLSVNEDQISDNAEFCGGGLDDALLGALKGFLFPLFAGGLIDSLGGQLEQALCQPANLMLDPPCPVGTVNVDGVCRYGDSSDAECASILLGLDGNIDLGTFLSSFSPGTRGALDFLFSAGGHTERDDQSGFAWGDLNPVNSGISLGFYGGTEPTPISGCVPAVPVTLPSAIPIPNEMLANSVTDWPEEIPGPHFGFALSERFTNYGLAQAYNSGALCLGITGDTIPELSTALIAVGIGASSMSELTRLKQPGQVAIVVRPQSPPNVTVGNGTDIVTDPLLRLRMDQLGFDFYVWSHDRFVRALTATFDVEIPLNLEVTPDGLQPVIEELLVDNGVVTNSQLVREDPDKIAGALQGLLGSMVGSLLGDSFPAIDLNAQLSSLGIKLEIPATIEGQGSPGLRKLTSGADNFLGIFASMELADGQPMMSVTQADVIAEDVDAEGLFVKTYDGTNGPRFTVQFGSNLDTGAHAVEYQYKVDNQPWHPFTRDRIVTVDDDWLRVQTKHTIYVRSRLVGQPFSLDSEPVALEVRVDAMPPAIAVVESATGEVAVDVQDAVSDREDTKVRVRLGTSDGDTVKWLAWSAWVDASDVASFLPDYADMVEVEAVDEEGNIGTVTQALIRGRGQGGDCQCTTPGAAAPQGGRYGLLALLLGVVVVGRRKLRSGRKKGSNVKRDGLRRLPARARLTLAGLAVLVAGSTSGCSCGEDAVTPAPTGCRERGDCDVLYPGLIGSYTSADVSPSGELWVSGYVEANWEDAWTYGDLVVGKWDGERVDWIAADGVPSEPPVDVQLYDPTGFRGGQTEAGDDVGLWTSLAVDDAGNPAVAYYDVTNRALRYAYATQADGVVWNAVEVQKIEGGDVGRYAKLLFVAGKPVIAYHFTEPGDGGLFKSGVRVASGSGAGTDATWSFDDVTVDPATPCRDYLCPTGTECLLSGQCADLVKDCDPECPSGEKCVTVSGASSCEIPAGGIEAYPLANGLYVSAAPHNGGVGLAYYDRIKGNLLVATESGGTWTSVVVDGEAGGEDNGDKGIGASLAIDSLGDFHIAYVDGLTESLNYVLVQGGTTPGTPEIIDDGLSLAGTPFTDGQHIVGDDSNIMVSQSGEIHVSYQDATAGTLRYAVGTPAAGAHEWTAKAVEQEGFAGFFSKFVEHDGALKIVNFWRVASPATAGDVSVVSP